MTEPSIIELPTNKYINADVAPAWSIVENASLHSPRQNSHDNPHGSGDCCAPMKRLMRQWVNTNLKQHTNRKKHLRTYENQQQGPPCETNDSALKLEHALMRTKKSLTIRM